MEEFLSNQSLYNPLENKPFKWDAEMQSIYFRVDDDNKWDTVYSVLID